MTPVNNFKYLVYNFGSLKYFLYLYYCISVFYSVSVKLKV